jgi:predicted Zn-ribbon and HTH transcriptional regulator
MSFIMRLVAHCEVCGHEWLTDKIPSHCAKCKSRLWNKSGQKPKSPHTRMGLWVG